jgi:hypothetical protein
MADIAGAASCEQCPWYRPRHKDAAALSAAAAAGHPVPEGICHRWPRIELKRPADFCGEHPLNRQQADQQLADAVAWAVSTMLAAAGLAKTELRPTRRN